MKNCKSSLESMIDESAWGGYHGKVTHVFLYGGFLCPLSILLLKITVRLVKDITISDLNEEDIQCLNCGSRQLLPQRDHANRPIFCIISIGADPLLNTIGMVCFSFDSIYQGFIFCCIVYTSLPRSLADESNLVRLCPCDHLFYGILLASCLLVSINGMFN